MKKELFFLDDTIRHYVYEKVALDIKCIEAVADENNVAANKVLEKCGFKLTGKNYYAHHYKNAYFNDNIYCYFIWARHFTKKETQENLCFFFLVEITRFELVTYALRTHRSTNWAIPPRIFCSYCSTFFKNVNTFCRMIKSLFKTDFQKPAFCLTKRKNVCKLDVENVSVAQ